jgi:hypothetical protein
LTFRVVNGRYYVTNPSRREVVVMNQPAFQTLQLSHGKTKDELHKILRKSPGTSQIQREEMLRCLEEFRTLHLINY